ncbi:MAG: UbiA family prenyltransferase [Planctomycetes bacterium]|nr:UbiA family prenyltransferase [Planctomycetota bacterium]MCB9868518.1 UbiA family prenyltransferase [Planctomycetota bacterium]
MVLGVVVAVFYEPSLVSLGGLPRLVLAVFATCLVASSNYVLNEILDGRTDAEHPLKKHRPVPSGRVRIPLAYGEWLLLAAAGFALGFYINAPFGLAAVSLWVMGTFYNVPPIRTKELPYVDVITESVNNPIRLLLGWFALIDNRLPPLSLLLSYWALGAFFMGTKRFAELRMIGDRTRAASYRRSFVHYTEDNLLVSMFFYMAACAFFGGIFMVRCKLELVLFVPFAAGMFALYLRLGLKPDSPVQNPERLHRERGFFAYTVACFVLFVLLMFTRIPALYAWFEFDPPKAPALWVF